MIHYHGTRFSGDATTAVRALSRRHALVSFAEPSQIEICGEVCQSFILDNGAFTYWKNGKPFDMDGYVEFVKKWVNHPACDWYILPDSIDGGVDANRLLRASWFKEFGSFKNGVPVWHLDEPLDELLYLSVAYDRIALGSSGAFRKVGSVGWHNRMAEAMEVICDSEGRPKVKLHGLRMLDPEIFGEYPLASADSTNVGRSIGIDNQWTGTYIPKSKEVRAEVIMDRVEHRKACSNWIKPIEPRQNYDLFND